MEVFNLAKTLCQVLSTDDLSVAYGTAAHQVLAELGKLDEFENSACNFKVHFKCKIITLNLKN